MIFRENERKAIRKCELEWHCHKVKLEQKKLNGGYQIEGYGIIKSHEGGGLYLDFVCLRSNKRIDYLSPIPEDLLDKNQSLSMTATAIDGIEILSYGLRIETTLQKMMSPDPTFYRVWLDNIEINHSDDDNPEDCYLHIEFNEKCSIPTNKSNTTESTLGTKSSSWNQTVLNHSNFEINIIHHEFYTEVYANGSGISLKVLKDAIIFYLGFTSGRFIQPYYEYTREGADAKERICRVDRKKSKSSIPSPVRDYVFNQDKKSMDDCHFDIFNNICDVLVEKPLLFESVYSQWKRVWHSFLSPEFSVHMLTVSVAIEGLLNDVFIPVLARSLRDEEFEQEKARIAALIGNIEGVSGEHIDSIKRYVEKWGNIHPKKALEHLVEKRVLEKHHIKNWVDLRNSSAHPKLTVPSEGRKRKNIGRTIVCLGLFYRLSLNIFSFKGAQYAYEKPRDDKLVIYEYVNILH